MKRKIIGIVFVALFAVVCILSLFLPLPAQIGRAEARYRCVWENGTSQETFASVHSAICGASEVGVLLERDGTRGVIEGSERFSDVFATLGGGSLAELLSLQSGGLSAPEQVALLRTFSGYVWYAEGSFVWNGEKVVENEKTTAQTVVLLSGELKRGYLSATGATSLVVCAEAQVSAEDFVGSAVETLVAKPPYFVSNEALYLQTAGGKRLVAALPNVTSLSVDRDTRFLDDGALAPCTHLQTLEIPFVGNVQNPYFGSLFVTDGEGKFVIPSTLERVRVKSGKIYSHAFYGCDFLQEIDVRGVHEIEKDAFSDCVSLRRVTSSVELELAGFTKRRDGNEYIYEKES